MAGSLRILAEHGVYGTICIVPGCGRFVFYRVSDWGLAVWKVRVLPNASARPRRAQGG